MNRALRAHIDINGEIACLTILAQRILIYYDSAALQQFPALWGYAHDQN